MVMIHSEEMWDGLPPRSTDSTEYGQQQQSQPRHTVWRPRQEPAQSILLKSTVLAPVHSNSNLLPEISPKLEQQPAHTTQPVALPTNANTLRSPRCPSGPRCPFPNCRFQHRSNTTRRTRHRLEAYTSTPIPGGVNNTQNNRRNTSQARNLCPLENCRFARQHSFSILNNHISTHHAEQSLPETIIPWQMRPCKTLLDLCAQERRHHMYIHVQLNNTPLTGTPAVADLQLSLPSFL
jgi:hypothetical protein